MRLAMYANAVPVAVADGTKIAPGPGELGKDFLAFPHHNQIGVQLSERRFGSGGRMRPDAYEHSAALPNGVRSEFWNSQFRRRAPPEQITGSSRDHREMGPEPLRPLRHF